MQCKVSICLFYYKIDRQCNIEFTIFKGFILNVLSLLLIYAIVAGKSYSSESGLDMFTAISSNMFLNVIPVIGWSRGLFVSLISSRFIPAVVYGCLCFALLIVEIVAISHTKTDYYEDVLDGTVRKEQALQSIKDGKKAYIPRSSKEKSIKKFGINSGKGASVFLYKRLLERRRGQFSILSFTTILIVAAGIFLSVVLHAPYLAFLGLAAYLSTILQRINSWEVELNKIYIFLVPSQPESKLFFAILLDLFSSFIDSVIVLIIGLAIFRLGLFESFVGAIAYLSVSVLITGSSVIVRRIFGTDTKNPLVQIFPATALIVLILWNILTAGLLLFLGRGVLTKSNG